MSDQAIELARRLVAIGAVSFSPAEPYTWASGLLSPMYCDNRRTLAHPDIRSFIARSFEALISEHGLDPEAIIGVATGAVPHATILADRMQLPFGYVRTAAKGHGKRNQLEGFQAKNARVVVVEDLVSTGGSSIAAANAVAESGMVVQAVIAIFTYGFSIAREAFANEDIPFFVIVHLADLLSAAEQAGRLRAEDRAILSEWIADPVAWSNARKEAR